ncbi:hypothetical protein [Paludibacterium purpuratum]|uniref:Uncharacterized protein n=1 Tax=Paludibacterium purpuratum TaxID=1144873 RepID=A0A4R7BBA1_9NEIS|nr:hypothetical protein [Paludibacterium purpuratum]TDR82178.1 hypothetical protein DFP86_102292 [Paludibacterium purpuratum]
MRTNRACNHAGNCHHFAQDGGNSASQAKLIKASLENTLVNIDLMENRIFSVLQQQRRDIRQIIASL